MIGIWFDVDHMYWNTLFLLERWNVLIYDEFNG